MRANKRLKKRLIIALLIIVLIVSRLIFPASAQSTDYSLSNKTVTLDGVNDGTVEVDLVSAEGGTFYAFQADWTLKEKETSSYFTLTGLTAGGEATVNENNPNTGRVVWSDSSYTGFNVAAGGSVWKATYTVDKDTPAGEYTVGISVNAITGGTAGYSNDEDFDLTATITVGRSDRYTGTFTANTGVSSIDVYHTQGYESSKTVNPDETNVSTTLARNGSTGATDIAGTGQINFKVNLADHYIVEKEDISITYDGDKKYNNIMDSNDIFSGNEANYQSNMFRITGITGDIAITVTPRAQTPIVPEIQGVQASYEYTGSSIKPEITVLVSGTETALTAGTDYTVSYDANTELGTGKVYIHPVASSLYYFDDANTFVNFTIGRKTLTEANVTVPASMQYTGSTLTPSVTINANGTILVKDTDYTVEYSNQDGAANENITVTITGKGNYQTTTPIVKNVLISPKPDRAIDAISDDVLSYGGSKTYTQTADCEVTFVSSAPEIVSVTHSKSGTTSTNTINAVGVGEAVITVTYAETDEYAETSETFTVTVNKANLTITGATVSNKGYDKGTTATVTTVSFNDSSNLLTLGTDYTVAGAFENADVGTNKTVVVTVTLVGDAANYYALTSSTFNTTANITVQTITSSHITVMPTSFDYDGTAKEPTVTVEIEGTTLTQNTDYTVAYTNNINAGTGYAVITGTNNYRTASPISKDFTINPKAVTISVADIPNVTYNMEAQEPDLTVTAGTTTLIKGTDYNVTYSANTNAGENTATATVSKVAGGNYTFSNTNKTFTILPYTLTASDVALEYTTVRHNGSAKEPSVTVTLGEHTVPSSNYTVGYSNNVDIGEATVTVTATGANFNTTADPVTKTFNIIDKEVLTISGIADNQSITYTGNNVVLSGTLTVAANSGNIKASDLTTTWYDNNGQEIAQPKNVGSYSVKYSYSDDDYKGSLVVNFEITKKTSATPTEVTNGLEAIEGQTLADVNLTTTGLSWVDTTVEVLAGSHTYNAVYTQNNDTTNYTTENVEITVYGKKYINIATSVNGEGGTISASINHVLEGTEQTITLNPEEGYEVARVTVNGTEKSVTNNTLKVTAGNNNMNVVAYFKVIQYTINVTANNAEITPSEVITVNYKANQDITIRANFGYKLKSVLVNNTEKINDLEDDVLTLSNITANHNIVVNAEKITYDYTEGKDQTYNTDKNTTATFVIDVDFELFSKLYVDGKLVDASNYTAKAGSTIITFKEAFLDTLSIGNHVLKVAFTDGGEAVTAFTVTDDETLKKSEEQSGNGASTSADENDDSSESNAKKSATSSMKTGDNVMKYVIFTAIALAGIFVVQICRRK